MKTENNSEQMKKECHLILSKFSHEIRNPITLISSEMQLIASDHPEVTNYRCWKDMVDHMDYLKELLNEFSDYNNALRISLKSLDFNVFLNTFIPSLKHHMDYLGIHFETDIEENLPSISADPQKLKQALLNLLRNAQEAVKIPGGKILLKVFFHQNKICICIKDNGCGISSEHLADVFEPFVTYKSSGTGLGLAITKEIIEQHNGTITIKSSAYDGTEFIVLLG